MIPIPVPPDQAGGSQRSGPWRAAAPRAPHSPALKFHSLLSSLLTLCLLWLLHIPLPLPQIVFFSYSDVYCCSNFLSETKCPPFHSLKCVGLGVLFCFVLCFYFCKATLSLMLTISSWDIRYNYCIKHYSFLVLICTFLDILHSFTLCIVRKLTL